MVGKAAASAAALMVVLLWAPGAAQAAEDACPNGWSAEQTVEFAPPVPAIDSGVANPERGDGCTLLDEIWEGEPYATHGAFVSAVDRTTAEFVAERLLTAAEEEAIQRAA